MRASLNRPSFASAPLLAEKNLARADAFDEFGGQPSLRFGEIKIRDVDEFFGLLDERLGDGRVRVAEAIHGDAAAEVEVAFARDIKDVAARAMAQHEVKAAVAGHDIFREQFADGLVVVADNRPAVLEQILSFTAGES